ncbi:MAG: relaxase/mobilization nuclease [Sphingobacteriales bacterium]|nr:MAG: relaxase/mobilization nuclease [Sphingobacteriales bacterium]
MPLFINLCMIASQKIGKSFMGALNYNWKKLNHPNSNQRAELLDSNFTNLDIRQIKAEVELVKLLRPNLNRYVYHTSLNFSKDELAYLNNEKLLAIALDYLEANGFNNNQYFIFRHFDADHPHLHLLVNRIGFDGSVVSDSNNYKRSEAILRQLEHKYDLMGVAPSRSAAQTAATKDELEMVIRTGKPSDKMLLQEIIKPLLKQKKLTIPMLISLAEKKGVYLLFNQASTGRVTGITYFYNEFKIKGQALGNRYKWAELIKSIDYEQIRDSKAISEANQRTREKYDERQANKSSDNERRSGVSPVYRSDRGDASQHDRTVQGYDKSNGEDGYYGKTASDDAERPMEERQDADLLHSAAPYYEYSGADGFSIEIADDIDDAKLRRRYYDR